MTVPMPFSFVHCADLHLDSPFEGIQAAAPAIAAVLREATFTAFDRIIDLAIDAQVDFANHLRVPARIHQRFQAVIARQAPFPASFINQG